MEQSLGFSESEAHAFKTKNCLVHQSVARDIPENHPMTGRRAEGSRCIENGRIIRKWTPRHATHTRPSPAFPSLMNIAARGAFLGSLSSQICLVFVAELRNIDDDPFSVHFLQLHFARRVLQVFCGG